MTLEPGRQLLHYRITEKLGEGAMGVVYRAVDESLGRDVAIKVLPEAFQSDRERLSRFEREARTLAVLSHPDIAAIYGLHEAAATTGSGLAVRFLAMELAGGEDLSARLARGPLSLDEALPVAARIARALDYAHERGIVHRDLKPANVKLSTDGGVKILDFGLAKAIEGDPTTSGPKGSEPTILPTLTSAGKEVILGTAAYMSPEQARGQAVDRRTDVWAFGCLVFEMLTGRRAFPGDTISDTLAAVLRAEPDYAALPPATPEPVKRMIRRCLAKDAARRLRSVADAAVELDEALEGKPESSHAGPAPGGARRVPLVWIAGALVLGILGTLAAALLFSDGSPRNAPLAPTLTFRQLTFDAGGEGEPTIAPDGESFAYVKDQNGQADVFLQRIDGRNAINLTAGCVEDDTAPAFSPDGRRIAVRSECGGGGIFVMGAMGESSRRVADFGYSPAWSPDGNEIAVVTEAPSLPSARNTISEIFAVRVETGERRLITKHDAMHPSWSPDGRFLAFWGLRGTTSQRDLWTVRSDGSQQEPEAAVPVTEDAPLDWNPVWSPNGAFLYFSSTRGGTFNLWRVAMDPATGRRIGEPEAITAPSSWAGWLSISRDGRRIVFADRNARTSILRVRMDPAGRPAGPVETVAIGSLETDPFIGPSPNGDEIAFATTGLPQHLFVVKADGGGLRQLTDGPHRDRQPAYSPDGAWIAFQTDQFPSQLALIRSDGGGLHEVEGDPSGAWVPVWAPDGRRLAVNSQPGSYLIAISTGGAGTVTPLPRLAAGLNFWVTSWSPDGTMLAGANFREGQSRGVAVFSLSDGAFRQIAAGSVSRPQFTADGRRLIADDGDGLTIYDVATLRSEPMLRPPAGRQYGFPAISMDRRWLALLELGDESDVWLASLDEAAPHTTRY